MRRVLTHRVRTESGASAVEFALVSVILMPMLFGILQYGLFFNDSLQVRQGLRQSVRSAVVQTGAFSFSGCTGGDAAQLSCLTKQDISPVTGAVSVHAVIGGDGTWKQGNPLLVCAVVASAAKNVGILPVPNGGYTLAKTQMSIEQNADSPSSLSIGDADPTGSGWSWCS